MRVLKTLWATIEEQRLLPCKKRRRKLDLIYKIHFSWSVPNSVHDDFFLSRVGIGLVSSDLKMPKFSRPTKHWLYVVALEEGAFVLCYGRLPPSTDMFSCMPHHKHHYFWNETRVGGLSTYVHPLNESRRPQRFLSSHFNSWNGESNNEDMEGSRLGQTDRLRPIVKLKTSVRLKDSHPPFQSKRSMYIPGGPKLKSLAHWIQGICQIHSLALICLDLCCTHIDWNKCSWTWNEINFVGCMMNMWMSCIWFSTAS